MAGTDEVVQDPLGVRSFNHVLDLGGPDPVAVMLGRGLAGHVVLIAPAEVPDRADINEADLQRFRGAGGREQGRGRGREGAGADEAGELTSEHMNSVDLMTNCNAIARRRLPRQRPRVRLLPQPNSLAAL